MHQVYSKRIICNPEIINSKLRIPNAKIKRFEMFFAFEAMHCSKRANSSMRWSTTKEAFKKVWNPY